ncbi:Secreted protein OS=Streptomyces tendae OX=1932 GN=GUR47_18935 PE=4 SV=1 [Streptomyces tendae]
MPRGRHRHSPPLHRLLPPSAIAGVSVVCALAPWLFSDALILRVLAAAAAVTAVVGAVVMRHWDTQAGRQVADLTRARASDEWRFEERVAELESDLEESRELRQKLEHRLRAKRTELAGLRNEHASLLRRYATAETERASALEGRRLLEIEAAPQTPALPAARTAPAQQAPGASRQETPGAPGRDASAEETSVAEAAGTEASAEESGGAEEAAVPAVFSPEGSRLFLRANAALSRLDDGAPSGPDGGDRADGSDGDGGGDGGDGGGQRVAAAEAGQEEDEAEGQSEAADGHERSAAASPAPSSDERPAQSTQPTRRTEGHFTVPTAVAVVPAAPARRPVVEGDFDFFGTKHPEDAAQSADGAGVSDAALETVQNEDLADVVGQEALALHKAEAEVSFKQAGEESRGVGQVIDLTAHDETEQIDVQGLRSAVS